MMKRHCVIAALLVCFVTSTIAAHVKGRVIDTEGNPVPEAEVCISYTTHSLAGYIPFVVDWNAVVHHKWIKTEQDGTFSVYGSRGFNWNASGGNGARKTGYEYNYPVEYDPTNHTYLIRMRKRLNPGFLHHEPYAECQFKRPGWSITWDFIIDEKLQVDPPKRRVEWTSPMPRHTPDVLIDARFDISNRAWRVTFRTPSDNGGILAAANKVYEAPDAGYADHLSFDVPVSRQAQLGPQCVLIRSRTPQIFTRLDVKAVVATEEFIRLCFDAFTNPFGDRSLDIDPRTETDYFIRKKLIKDSKTAWQEDHPPLKPDFQTLLQSVNEFKDN